MRFLLEADNQGLLGIKKDLETSSGKSYKSMNDSERLNFIGKVLNKSSNINTLKPVIVSVAEAIKDSNWDKNVVKYFDKINLPSNLRLTDGEIKLITELLADNKISPNASWLYNKSLYDRDVSDVIYTIKALTLANNEKLQTDTQNGQTINKYFKNNKPLKVSHLTNKDGTIKQASEIEDIINKRTDMEKSGNQFGISKSELKKKMQDIANKNNTNTDVDKLVNEKNEAIKGELEDILKQLGVNQAERRKMVDASFEEGQTVEYLLNKIFKGIG